MSDQPTPIAPERVAEELQRISAMKRNGELDADEYEHRFARMVSELRDRRISGGRKEIVAAIAPHMKDGTIEQAAVERLLKQLGIV